MNYEEKLKEALNGGTTNSEVVRWIERNFPELAESEDEGIRKNCIHFLELQKTHHAATFEIDECIAWLEKQGEQKPTDKVEQKFKVGDWVVYKNDICQIVKREEGCNKLVTNFGIEKELVNERNLSAARLWTIQDAKDGDVLATSAGAFIYNGNNGGGSCPGSYCGINTLGGFKTGVEHHWTGKKVYPATKEQRDLLFSKMKEAGYEWDAEKRELKKIESPATWIDEDIAIISRVISIVKWAAYSDHSHPILNDEGATELVERLKSLKDKYTWKPSEEMLEALYRAVPDNVKEMSEDEMLLDKLYQGLKYGRVLS